MDDILIYSNSVGKHNVHVKKILEKLCEAELQVDITKCEFNVTEVKYLGLIITTKGIKMDPAKVEAITGWPTPQNMKDVQSFLGFANFYRRCVFAFSKLSAPLTELTKKDQPWSWGIKQQMAFDTLCKKFMSDLVLHHFDPDKKIVVETDASDYVSAGILLQFDESNVLRPVAFFSRKHLPAECNYEIYNKELLAIVTVFEEWRPELEGSKYPVQVLSDHKNLEWFMTTKQLSRCQVRWSEFLSRFDFTITYRPGKQGEKPNALTQRSGDLPSEEGGERLRYQRQAVLKAHNLAPGIAPLELHIMHLVKKPPKSHQDNLQPSRLAFSPINLEPGAVTTVTDDEDDPENDNPDDVPLATLWEEGYEKDTFKDEILELLRNNARKSSKITLAKYKEREGKLFWHECRYVPESDPLRLRLIQECHCRISAGHPGKGKTYQLLSRHYWWPNCYDNVKRFVRNCHTCSCNKASRLQYQGWLKPLPPPD